jgi:flagellar protein FliO/FliZ
VIAGLIVATDASTLADGELWRSLFAVVVVFGLLGGLAWAARRGRLSFFTKPPANVRVEATVPLGERRSLMVVAIEGRRLLLGLTPMHVSFVTELSGKSFDAALAQAEQGSAASGASTTHTP